jgi:tetratricopeptide (TPR) repeat protein
MMADTISGIRQNATANAEGPFAHARERLFPPLQNRILAQAAAALADSQVALAQSLIEGFLAKKPRDASALNLKAEIARRAGRFEAAEQLLRTCVELSPDTEGYRYNYAVVLRHLHRHDEGLEQLDKLLAGNPRNVLYRDQKATLLTEMGRHSEALVCRRELSEEFPRSAELLLRFGDALRDDGQQTECIAVFRRALQLEAAPTSAYASLASLKVYRFTAEDIEAMEKQLKSGAVPPDARAGLHHALGKAYGDQELYGKSFEHYAKGNAVRRLEVNFDGHRVTTHRKACETFFSVDFFRERSGWGCDSKAPIFIVGLPRSGSTLLEQILSSHGGIEGLGELAELDTTLVGPLADMREGIRLEQFANGKAVEKSGLANAYVQIFDRLRPDQFRSMGELYLELTGRRRETQKPFFTDKTLRNFFYVGLIHLILPNSKIIDVRRHPLDCGWSCFKSQFSGGQYFALRLGDIGDAYVNYVRLMAHFDKVLPGRIHRVIYEQLVADPEAELGRLFEYLELPFEERCLRFYENKRPVHTLSSQQVRIPLYGSGVAQWLPYEPWLGPLKSALGPLLESYPGVPE